MSTNTTYIAAAGIPAAFAGVGAVSYNPATSYNQATWLSAVKPSSHREGTVVTGMTDADFGRARRPRGIPL
jgi:hypothetical protein